MKAPAALCSVVLDRKMAATTEKAIKFLLSGPLLKQTDVNWSS